MTSQQSCRTYSLQQVFSNNSQVFFEYIYTVLSVFFSFIVICFHFTKISTCTCPISVLIYNFKVDGVTKSFVHFRPCAFSRKLIHRKCARAKMQVIFGHYICFEIINKNTFRTCTCRYFGKIKANNYKGKEYGQDSINIFEKYLYLMLKIYCKLYVRHDQSFLRSRKEGFFNPISKIRVIAYHFYFITILRNKYLMYIC